MTEWRFLRGWSETELAERLAALEGLGRNFSGPVEELTPARGWRRREMQAIVAREAPGPPEVGGAFERAREGVENFRFSDPRIVVGYFDPAVPLARRRMLLELKAVGLRYLCGAAVGAVRVEQTDERTVFGFRYETLEGHIERGTEWFLLTKDHESGAIGFSISAVWQPGDFPNWWSRVGFAFLARHYQTEWFRRALDRLALIATGACEP